ncbi:hypothetical protein D3C71_1487800 [compost metagenome]
MQATALDGPIALMQSPVPIGTGKEAQPAQHGGRNRGLACRRLIDARAAQQQHGLIGVAIHQPDLQPLAQPRLAQTGEQTARRLGAQPGLQKIQRLVHLGRGPFEGERQLQGWRTAGQGHA